MYVNTRDFVIDYKKFDWDSCIGWPMLAVERDRLTQALGSVKWDEVAGITIL